MRGRDRLERLQLVVRATAEEQLPLHVRGRIPDGEAEQESIELRLRQRIRAGVLVRVLRRENQEGRG